MRLKMKMKTIGVVALIFGVIAVAGVFLEWIYVPLSDTSVTGWDIFDERINDSWLDYIPLASVILGALCFVIGILSLASRGPNLASGFLLLIFGIACLVLPIYMYYDMLSFIVTDYGYTWSEVLDMYQPGIGGYLEIVSGFVLFIFGILGLTVKE